MLKPWCCPLILSSFFFSNFASAHHPGAVGISKALRAPQRLAQTSLGIGSTTHFFYRAPRPLSYENPTGEVEDLLFAQSFNLFFTRRKLGIELAIPLAYRPAVPIKTPIGLGDLQTGLAYELLRRERHFLQLSVLNAWPSGSRELQISLGLFSQEVRATYQFSINKILSIRSDLGTRFFYAPNTALVLIQEQSLRLNPHLMVSLNMGLQSQVFLKGGEWPGLQVQSGERILGDIGIQANMSISLLLNPSTQLSLQGAVPILGPRNNDGSVSLGFSKSFGL